MAKKSEIASAALGALTGKEKTSEPHHPGIESFKSPEDVIACKMKNETILSPSFTGIARSVVCIENQSFKNFQIVTLHIENGKVTKMELSDKWANFETISILDHVSHLSMIHLNNNWKDGKALEI